MARKQKTIHYIYKTTCLVTNRYYIGMHSTSNLKDGYMGSGKRLRYSIRKYGVENHKKEILEFFETRELLIKREIEIVNTLLINDKLCMNLREGGTGGFSIEQQKLNNKKSLEKQKFLMENDEEWKNKKIENLKQSMLKQYSEGKRIKIYFYDRNNVQHNDETKNKISLSKKGKTIGEENSQFNTCWITKNNINKKIKKEELSNYKLDGWKLGRIVDEKTKEKISKSTKGKFTGKLNSQYGTCWINKDGKFMKIKKEELEHYLSLGWLKGMGKLKK